MKACRVPGRRRGVVLPAHRRARGGSARLDLAAMEAGFPLGFATAVAISSVSAAAAPIAHPRRILR